MGKKQKPSTAQAEVFERGTCMGRVVQVISGMGILIAIYLFLSNATATVSIIDSIGGQAGRLVGNLQGRK